MRKSCLALTALLTACAATPLSRAGAIAFEDVTAASGLQPLVAGWHVAHAAAWGDADGDGAPDLYIGAFADRPVYKAEGAPIPNQLFLNRAGSFVRSDEQEIRLDGLHARTTMAFFFDVDNDGDLDLFTGQHASATNQFQSALFENTGGGKFRDATPAAGDWPRPLGIRNATAVDMDHDGLLDLVWTDGNYSNWKNDGGRLIVLRNLGNGTFKDVGASYGLPATGTVGMGLAIGDLNDDGYMDFFVADGNRMLVSKAGPSYAECQPGGFPRATGPERHTCGAAFGDLDGDGRLDLVTAVHGQPARLSVYRNTGVRDGMPAFEDISARLGLAVDFPKETPEGKDIKTAQVAICDMDNDGLNDLYVAVTFKDADGKLQPLVLRNLGVKDGLPSLSPLPLDRLVTYYAPGPLADYDGDGDLDAYLPAWYPDQPSILFRNMSKGGNWLTVRVRGAAKGFNRMGVGATVRAYKAGAAGEPAGLLARRDIVIGQGYSSGDEALAHIGLGAASSCDITVDWQGTRKVVKAVPANQPLTVAFE